MKRALFLFFLLLFAKTLFPSTVSIEGKAPSYKGDKAELVGVSDLYTKMDTVLDSARVGQDSGAFRLRADCERIRPAWVRIGNARSKIYLEPGTDYDVKFPEIPEEKIKRAHGHTDLKMTFYDLQKHDANNLVIDINRIYDRFFAKNYRAMGVQYASGGSYKRNRPDIEQGEKDSLMKEKIAHAPGMGQLMDSLDRSLKERYSEVDEEWFQVHVQHVLASIRSITNKDRQEAYERYFKNGDVRFHHEEYMDHFFDFFDEYLINFDLHHDSILNLQHVLSHKKAPAPILRALRSKEAEFMGRRSIRELVLIDGMFDAFYHRKPFDRSGIHAVLDSLVKNGSKKEVRQIADHLSEFLSNRQRGSKAPSFRLMDQDTTMVSLEELKGKPIYLNFWAKWNETSLKGLRMIEKLHEHYGKNIRFVSICTDDKLRDMKKFLKKHPEYDWTFLYLGDHDKLEKAYQVSSIPAYYLLNGKGRFIRIPAPKPGENARAVLHDLNTQVERRKKRNDGRGSWDH